MADEAGRERAAEEAGRRRPAGLVLFWVLVVPAVALLGLGAWLFADDWFVADHPFGDSRACAGSDTALLPALQGEAIGLPGETDGMRYWTHMLPGAPSRGFSFVAVFHTSRQSLKDYLATEGFADPDSAAGPDEANEGSSMGEPMGEGAGCGTSGITASFVTIPRKLDTDRQFTLAIEMGPEFKIPAKPEVIITVG